MWNDVFWLNYGFGILGILQTWEWITAFPATQTAELKVKLQKRSLLSELQQYLLQMLNAVSNAFWTGGGNRQIMGDDAYG